MFRILFGFILLFSQACFAVERIASFDSDITIHHDSSITIRETLEVVGEARTIRHGIVREFPTQYKDRWGNTYNVLFRINKVLLDGHEVPYHVQDEYNGKKIFIGEREKILGPGNYTYVIEYETKRQIGFFDSYDELYWNVTGTGWRLPIDQASANVKLPSGVPVESIQVDGYTGYQGQSGKKYTAQITKEGVAQFRTTDPLLQRQGLTIVVIWPKGYVTEPTWAQQWRWFFEDNQRIFFSIVGLFFLLLFYCFAWMRFRRSQRLDTVIPLFYPPEHMSPGHMRYFNRMGYDSKVLAADIVNMAVNGFVRIRYDKKFFFGDAYTLEKKEKPHGQFEKIYSVIDQNLFGSSHSVALREKNKTQINGAIDAISDIYAKETAGDFQTNIQQTFLGVLLALSFGAISLLFGGGFSQIGIGFVLVSLCYVGMIILFAVLLRGYSPKGLAIKKQIDGFKMFLVATEEERLKIIGTPPTKTPELYETYLPYAIALGVEKQWSKQFAPLFERMTQEGHPYTFVWIAGGRFDHLNMNTFASGMSSSISNSIASSASIPGSSSGFGGRGSSGGGGGGGGGGGW